MPAACTYGTKIMGGLFAERSTENPLMMLLGQPDLAFITLNILPLLRLALGFNIISSERESGTLAW
jgi:ABC-2 type transport system permease protein